MSHIVKNHTICNNQLKVTATNKNHYVVSGYTGNTNNSKDLDEDLTKTVILFQDGEVGEFGINGVTPMVLLAIVQDYLCNYQGHEYFMAMTKVNEALHWLQQLEIEEIRNSYVEFDPTKAWDGNHVRDT